MTTFLLVHGAWGGAHGFRHVRRILQAEGHEVFTPSLTGIGERVHLASPLVNLSTHVRDVTNQILYEDLQEIVLVGFSYGGFVISGALEHIADRVSDLVYLDAFVPRSGESVFGHLRGESRSKIELGEDLLVSGPAREYDDPAEAEWMTARRTTHPKGCFTEPVYISKPLEDLGSAVPTSKRPMRQLEMSETTRFGVPPSTRPAQLLGGTLRWPATTCLRAINRRKLHDCCSA